MNKKTIAATALSLSVFLPSAHAQEAEFDVKHDWRAQITPYVWAPSLSANLKPLSMAPHVHAKQSFSDVFKTLRLAAFISGSVRYKNWVLLADYTYASTSKKENIPVTHLRAKVKQRAFTLIGGYSFKPNEKNTIDLTAGIRSWDITAQIDVSAVPYRWKAKADFVDPIVSARWMTRFNDHWSLLFYGDVGVGSRQTRQLLTAVNYKIDDGFYATLGYRHLQVDYKNDGKRFDLKMNGPVLGVTYVF